MEIKHYSLNDKIEILGYIFNGIEDIEKAVEYETRISNSIGERYIQHLTPENSYNQIHILKLYQPYPKFDESDMLYENRRFCNYFFSHKPFTQERINKIADIQWTNNYCLIHKDMDEDLLPALYWGGSTWDDLIVAL